MFGCPRIEKAISILLIRVLGFSLLVNIPVIISNSNVILDEIFTVF